MGIRPYDARVKRPLLIGSMLLAIALAYIASTPGNAAELQRYAYSVLAPAAQAESQLIVRVVQPSGEACPSLSLTVADAPVSVELTKRPAPSNTGEYFSSVMVCEVAAPSNAAPLGTITYADGSTATVPTAIQPVSSLALIGDTGCRLVHNIQQECDSDREWPLRVFARQIAKQAPQAVVHVGDYLYNEWPCEDDKICGDVPRVTEGEPFLDSAASFEYSFLSPFAPVFPVAPILMLRGNQEACNVDGISYFYFLDPQFNTSQMCDPNGRVAPEPMLQPYAVDLPTTEGTTLRLVATDSTYANDQEVDSWAAKMRPKFKKAEAIAKATPQPGSAWLLTHRPVFAVRSTLQCGDVRCAPFTRDPNVSMWISADTAAASYGTLKPYSAIISGHVHLTQAVQVTGAPAQIVLGGGGTALDPTSGYKKPEFGVLATGRGVPMRSKFKPYPTVRQWTTKVVFSYATAEPQGRTWAFQAKNVKDKTVARCRLSGKKIKC